MFMDPFANAEPQAAQPLADVSTLTFADLYSRDLDMRAVDLVIAPLVGLGFDSVELIENLGRAGFRGRLRVTATWLPDADMVLRELQTLAEPRGITVTLSVGKRAHATRRQPG